MYLVWLIFTKICPSLAAVPPILLGPSVTKMWMSAKHHKIRVKMELLVLIFMAAMLAVVFMAGKDLIAPSTRTTVCPLMGAPCVIMAVHVLIKWENMTAFVLQEKQVNNMSSGLYILCESDTVYVMLEKESNTWQIVLSNHGIYLRIQ